MFDFFRSDGSAEPASLLPFRLPYMPATALLMMKWNWLSINLPRSAFSPGLVGGPYTAPACPAYVKPQLLCAPRGTSSFWSACMIVPAVPATGLADVGADHLVFTHVMVYGTLTSSLWLCPRLALHVPLNSMLNSVWMRHDPVAT
jgi:hypothetical protein